MKPTNRALFARIIQAGLFLLPLCLPATLPEGYDRLILSRQASPEVHAAAAELADLIERQYGERPLVRPEPLWRKPRGIYIGPAPVHPAFDRDPLTDEILVERTAHGLALHGQDNTATRFAVYRFLEHFLGWRRYQPGPLGLERLESAPPPPPVTGDPARLLHEKAGFFSRHPSFGNDPQSRHWQAWHGVRERFRYNHTLHKVLPPKVFDARPELFAKDASGKPMRPPYYPEIHGYNDHPDLTHPGVRNRAAEAALAALERDTAFSRPATRTDSPSSPLRPVKESPGIVSLSLSLGDSFVFGHFPEDYPWNPEGYFRRWPDWSNHVFAYTGEVARKILAGWESGTWSSTRPRPKLYLGALAYLNWEQVPDVPLHPAVVPYLTFDRSQWHDPRARADDLRTVAAWNQTSAPFLGTWDYLFGYGFLLPRSLSGIVADSIPALHERGVRAYYSQVLPVWPFDAHTNWLTTRLLWNPSLSPNALLNEFFTAFYGPAAASMRTFFDEADALWMKQREAGWWLRYWKDPWQAALWEKADLDRLARLLERALAETATTESPLSKSLSLGSDPAQRPLSKSLSPDRFHERVRQTHAVFTLTQAFHRHQEAFWNLQSGSWESARRGRLEEGLARVEEVRAAREVLIARRDAVVRDVPLAGRLRDLDWVFRYDSLEANEAAIRLRLGPSRATDVLHDTTFEKIDNPRIWHRQFMDSEAMHQSRDPRSGHFVIKNVRRGHLYQLFKAVPGRDYLARVQTATHQSPSGEVYIRIDFFNADHELIERSPRSRIAPVGRFGAEQTLRALLKAPEKAAYGRLFIRFYELDAGRPARVKSARVLQLPQ